MSDLSAAYQYVDDNAEDLVADLQRIVRQPSVSSSGEGVKECAELLVELMQAAGMEARAVPTSGQPIVFGEAKSNDPNRADAAALLPLRRPARRCRRPALGCAALRSPALRRPHRRTRDDGRQGQCHGLRPGGQSAQRHLRPADQSQAFIFDGEEESGSPSLPEFVEQHRDMLAADAILGFDGGYQGRGQKPHVSLGNSGLLTCQLLGDGAARRISTRRVPGSSRTRPGRWSGRSIR
ncbi:MAG: hypothetical protein R2849_19590 [Thermomicrobiales bacterium]